MLMFLLGCFLISVLFVVILLAEPASSKRILKIDKEEYIDEPTVNEIYGALEFLGKENFDVFKFTDKYLQEDTAENDDENDIIGNVTRVDFTNSKIPTSTETPHYSWEDEYKEML